MVLAVKVLIVLWGDRIVYIKEISLEMVTKALRERKGPKYTAS